MEGPPVPFWHPPEIRSRARLTGSARRAEVLRLSPPAPIPPNGGYPGADWVLGRGYVLRDTATTTLTPRFSRWAIGQLWRGGG